MNNQTTFDNFTYNTKCNIWKICLNSHEKLYNLKNYRSDEYNITIFNNDYIYNNDFCINHTNKYYGELCTMYYVWKNNLKSDIVGFDQYRRHWYEINYDNINKGKIQTFNHWLENRCILTDYNYVGNFLHSFILYINNYFPEYSDRLQYLVFKYPFYIKDHINIFMCKWEIFEKICTIIFGFLNTLMPNNTWKNIETIKNHIILENNIYKKINENNQIFLNNLCNFEDRYIIYALENLMGLLYNIISESFEQTTLYTNLYAIYDCYTIDDYYNILQTYKYNIGNGLKLILVNDINDIFYNEFLVKNENIAKNGYAVEYNTYQRLFATGDNFKLSPNRPFLDMYTWEITKAYSYNTCFKHMKSNEYIFTESTIEFHKDPNNNFEIKTL